MKTEVYSWRVSRELKSELEEEARRRNLSLSAMLDLAVTEWLKNHSAADTASDEEEQRRLHAAAAKYVGSFASGVATRSANVSKLVKERLRRQHGRLWVGRGSSDCRESPIVHRYLVAPPPLLT